MQYRNFGKVDFKPSALGFGAMRLPKLEDGKKVDEAEAIRMMRYAIDHGVNYVDTASGYHGGQSEVVVGKALLDGYRDKVMLASKMSMGDVPSWSAFDEYLKGQLERLQTDHIDFYLLHALKRSKWPHLRDQGIMEYVERARDEGRIRHIGFSFHDNYDLFKEIVDHYDWEFCQIQYNYLDIKNQAEKRGLKYAADKGMAVVIMEPLLGGKLADQQPQAVEEVWQTAPRLLSHAEWALHWLWDQPEVSVVISGMSTMDQVKENLLSAGESGVGAMTDEERALIKRIQDAYQGIRSVPCTDCRYCMPCPNGVNIPGVFKIYNDALIWDDFGKPRWRYANRLQDSERADKCVECGKCEEACPQHIAIRKWLDKAHEALSA